MQKDLNEFKVASEQTFSCDYKSFTDDSYRKNEWEHESSGIIHYPSPIRAEMLYLSRNSNENPSETNDQITEAKKVSEISIKTLKSILEFIINKNRIKKKDISELIKLERPSSKVIENFINNPKSIQRIQKVTKDIEMSPNAKCCNRNPCNAKYSSFEMFNSPSRHKHDIKMFSSKMKAKRKYLDKIPITEEDKQAILKHHLEKANIRDSRMKKVIYEQTKIKPFSLGRIETKDMILNHHHRESTSPLKSKEFTIKRFGLMPLNNPSILVSSPLSNKFDVSNFHKQLEHLLIPENMVKQFENMRVNNHVPVAFKHPLYD